MRPQRGVQVLKVLLGLALLVFDGPTDLKIEPFRLEPVPLVICGNSSGSAFRIGPNLMLSVKHVTRLNGCMIDGQPQHLIYSSPKADFSMLRDQRAARWIKVDCRGFVAGRHYFAIGHARGLDQLTTVELIATGAYDDGMAVLAGIMTAQPGQSGGPIIDAETHQVVGTVNAANWEEGTTFSVELKQTPVCGSDLA